MKRLERNIGESLGQLIARKMVKIESNHLETTEKYTMNKLEIKQPFLCDIFKSRYIFFFIQHSFFPLANNFSKTVNLKENFVLTVLASILFLTLSYNNKREYYPARAYLFLDYELI